MGAVPKNSLLRELQQIDQIRKSLPANVRFGEVIWLTQSIYLVPVMVVTGKVDGKNRGAWSLFMWDAYERHGEFVYNSPHWKKRAAKKDVRHMRRIALFRISWFRVLVNRYDGRRHAPLHDTHDIVCEVAPKVFFIGTGYSARSQPERAVPKGRQHWLMFRVCCGGEGRHAKCLCRKKKPGDKR